MDSDVDIDRMLRRLAVRRIDFEGRQRFSKYALAKSLADSPAKAFAYLEESTAPVPLEYTETTFREVRPSRITAPEASSRAWAQCRN